MAIDLSTVTNISLGIETVTQIEDSLGNVLWSAALAEYFYVEDKSGAPNTLSITNTDMNNISVSVYYSTDEINWTFMGLTSHIAPITATIPANGRLYLKATTSYWKRGAGYNHMSATGDFAIGGNIMSLLNGDSFYGTSFTSANEWAFAQLFDGADTLVNTFNLVLPSNTCNYCYSAMFQGCTSLTDTPELPAFTMTPYCYQGMFENTALTAAPVLPATTLAESCYKRMFAITHLTTAPALPVNLLANNCYEQMFYNCTSLTTAPVLSATTLAQYCYYYMFQGCTALTTAPALPATTLAENCYRGMFLSCTALTTAPALPATTLANSCYQSMFNGCSLLDSVTTYANDISASNCLNNWLNNVAATGTFHNLGSATYTLDSASGIPTGWTEVNS